MILHEMFLICYTDIVNIEAEIGWNYTLCQLCKWKVKQQNNMFLCARWPNYSLLILYSYENDCIENQNDNFFNYRCKNKLITFFFLSLLYSVKSKWKMTTSFVLFDKEVGKIIQKIVLKLSSKVSNLNS